MLQPPFRRASFGLHLPGALSFALVVQFFALRQCQLAFDSSFFQVHLGGNKGQSFFARLPQEFVDLRAVQQQLAPAGRLVILAIAVRVLADVRVEQPGFVTRHFREAVLELNPAALGSFHFGSGKSDAGFEAFEQMVIMSGMSIVAQDFDSRFHGPPAFCIQRQESALRQGFMWGFRAVQLNSSTGRCERIT